MSNMKKNKNNIRYDATEIPNGFLVGRLAELNRCIYRLENEIATQESVNSIDNEFQNTVHMEMKGKLSYSKIYLSRTTNNKKRRVKKHINKTRLYNFDPLKPHFYIVKLGFTGVYIIFVISAQNID